MKPLRQIVQKVGTTGGLKNTTRQTVQNDEPAVPNRIDNASVGDRSFASRARRGVAVTKFDEGTE